MAFRIIVMYLFHLCMVKGVTACGGNSNFKVVEMCKGGSTTDRHFYLHGSSAGDLRRCDCNLTISGSPTSVYFTSVSVGNNVTTCGGTLMLPDGTVRDCGWTSRTNYFAYPGTGVVSFAYNSPDVRFCVEVEILSAESNLLITCPGNQGSTIPTASSLPSASPTSQFLATKSVTQYTQTTTTKYSAKFSTTPVSSTNPTQSHITLSANTQLLTKSTQPWTLSTSEGSTETMSAEKVKPVSGLLIAGWVIAAIIVAVNVVLVVLLIRKQRQSNYESKDTCQHSVSTQTDSAPIYEGLDPSNVTKTDRLYERINTQSAGSGVKDYYNIEMGDYCNP